MSIIESGPERPALENPTVVSINSQELSYERSDERNYLRLPGVRTAVLVIAVLAALTISIAAVLATANAVGANEQEPKIKAAHFTIGQQPKDDDGDDDQSALLAAEGAEVSASYRSIVIEDRQIELGLELLPGTVTVKVDEVHASALSAQLDGLRVGSASPDFADSLADAAASSDVHRFVRLAADGGLAAMDLTFPRALGTGDYLLVQDLHGDSVITLTALNYDGTTIGTPITVGPGYQWNTGHGPSEDSLSWASAVGIDRFGPGLGPIPVIRVSSDVAEFKVLALAPAGTVEAKAETAGKPEAADIAERAETAETTDTAGTTETDNAAASPEAPQVYAAVGVDAKIQPAIAVDGQGCETAADVATAETTVGQAATYCFVVTNLGTTHLTDIEITDEKLGLSNANLPSVSSAVLLAPGDQTTFYHHATVAPRTIEDLTVATARPTDASGTPIDGELRSTDADSVETLPSGQPDNGPTRADAPPVLANVVTSEAAADAAAPANGSSAAEQPAASPVEPVTQLALTGMVTEPWVLVIFAMAFIFIGYTAYAAFRQNAPADENSGHDQLDALGFD